MKKHFPLNYFSACFPPKTIFAKRGQLNWLQNVVILIFLAAVMVIPVTHFYTNTMKQFPMTNFLPEATTFLNDSAAEKVSTLTINDNEMLESDSVVFNQDDNGAIGTNLDQEVMENAPSTVSFNTDDWQITSSSGEIIYTMKYMPDFAKSVSEVQTADDLKNFLEAQFYQSNRPTLILSNSWGLGLVMFLMTSAIVFGGGFFLWLTRKSKLSDIHSYKESVNLMLNIFGLPTLVAAIISLFSFDFSWLIGVQTFGGVFMLLAVWAQTKFKDKKV
ncbi:hypothetical protein [Enterococcus timonensis]|uniref:hypothetical protein n=1 Tax=Enterococcus timonensis TaxID=1852364 RepID=UPI0008DB0F58|nr:hypothetical protein [Enterococcus timonensis]